MILIAYNKNHSIPKRIINYTKTVFYSFTNK